MMKKRWLYLIFPIIALILEMLPYGAVCNFASAPDELYRETFSYFSLTPFGYANFAPLLTAAITCVILIILVIYLFSAKHGAATAAKVLLCVDIVLSLCPLLYGLRYFSLVGALISASLTVSLILLFAGAKSSK